MYQGPGYYFRLPGSGDAAFRAEVSTGTDGERIVLLASGTPAFLEVEVDRSRGNASLSLRELERRTIERYEAEGAKVRTAELDVLKLPGFYAEVSGKVSFAVHVLRGKSAVYRIFSGAQDDRGLDLALSLGEGKVPPEQPKMRRPDPFSGRRLHDSHGDAYSPSAYSGGDTYAPPNYSESPGYSNRSGYAAPGFWQGPATSAPPAYSQPSGYAQPDGDYWPGNFARPEATTK
jgi:hypothetical protein